MILATVAMTPELNLSDIRVIYGGGIIGRESLLHHCRVWELPTAAKFFLITIIYLAATLVPSKKLAQLMGSCS
jgi:hypothetical protein